MKFVSIFSHNTVAKNAKKLGVFAYIPRDLAHATYVLRCIQTCPTHTNGGGIGSRHVHIRLVKVEF